MMTILPQEPNGLGRLVPRSAAALPPYVSKSWRHPKFTQKELKIDRGLPPRQSGASLPYLHAYQNTHYHVTGVNRNKIQSA